MTVFEFIERVREKQSQAPTVWTRKMPTDDG